MDASCSSTLTRRGLLRVAGGSTTAAFLAGRANAAPVQELRLADIGLREKNTAADNNAALQRLIDQLKNTDGPVRVIIGPGTFRIDPLLITPPAIFLLARSDMTIEGQGRDRSVFECQSVWDGRNKIRPIFRIGQESSNIALKGFEIRYARDCAEGWAPR